MRCQVLQICLSLHREYFKNIILKNMDKKTIVSVVKTLERTIGILECSKDTGELSDATRKRAIEMLNSAMLSLYFIDSKKDICNVEEEICEPAPTPSFVPEMPEWEAASNEEEIDAENTAVAENITVQEIIEEEIAEQIAPEQPEPEHITPEKSASHDELIHHEKVTPEQPEPPVFTMSDKPIIEWEQLQEEEIVEEPQAPATSQPAASDDEITTLKKQLEAERKRLEQELQQWQEEQRRRDEEFQAARKLLEALQQQTREQQQPKPATPVQPAYTPPVQPAYTPPVQTYTPPVQPAYTPPPVQPAYTPPPVQPTYTPPVQPTHSPVKPASGYVPPVSNYAPPVQQAPKPVVIPPIPPVAPPAETQNTLNDAIGSRKVLYENFEIEANQIYSPLPSLQKAIGINDRFRFIKELFGGDSDLYTETIAQLDNIGSLGAALAYIESRFAWDKNSDAVKQIISLTRRRYM
jgi:hypothetical protein